MAERVYAAVFRCGHEPGCPQTTRQEHKTPGEYAEACQDNLVAPWLCPAHRAVSRPGERYRVLVTGSRNWRYGQVVCRLLNRLLSFHPSLTVIHGDCPAGADRMADDWAMAAVRAGADVVVERYPADWAGLGREAGPARNRVMTGRGADLCLALIRDGSAGASGCARLAVRAGIPTRRLTDG
jgi:YspA, cpYpsA-related SLOG family